MNGANYLRREVRPLFCMRSTGTLPRNCWMNTSDGRYPAKKQSNSWKTTFCYVKDAARPSARPTTWWTPFVMRSRQPKSLV